MILEKVSPVTHSVGNCVKRVVVIVSSVVFFQTPVTFINSLGKLGCILTAPHSISLYQYELNDVTILLAALQALGLHLLEFSCTLS